MKLKRAIKEKVEGVSDEPTPSPHRRDNIFGIYLQNEGVMQENEGE